MYVRQMNLVYGSYYYFHVANYHASWSQSRILISFASVNEKLRAKCRELVFWWKSRREYIVFNLFNFKCDVRNYVKIQLVLFKSILWKVTRLEYFFLVSFVKTSSILKVLVLIK